MTKEEIANILKNIRQESGLTQKEAAEKLGRKQQTLASWETGQSQPDANTLFSLCRIYGTTVDTAFGFDRTLMDQTEKTLIKKYRILNEHGKKAVNAILEVEYENSQSNSQPVSKGTNEDYEEPANIIQFHIPEYWEPVSTGEGAWNHGDPPEDLLLRKRPPRGASFVVRVTGDSMEPTFHPGDRLFIRSQDYLDDGQIGIFVVDSCMYVKELRKGQLISHNPAYDPIPLNESARCQGLVLGVCDESYFEK